MLSSEAGMFPSLLVKFYTNTKHRSSFYNFLKIFVNLCFACMYTCVKMSDTLEVELQTVVNYFVDPGN